MGTWTDDPRKLCYHPLSSCTKSSDLQICSAYAIAVSAAIVVLVCFVHFDILQTVPTALLLGTAPLETHTHNAKSYVKTPKFSPASPPVLSNFSVPGAAVLVPSGSEDLRIQKQLQLHDIESRYHDSNGKKDLQAARCTRNKSASMDTAQCHQQLNLKVEKETISEASDKCDLFLGRWVRDDSYPLYHSEACPFIDGGFRCQENGRPDDGYLKWRWQPLQCNMPRFNAKDMLERLRGSRLVFVGDSIGRNQWESMICMLAQAVQNKSRIYEVNGQPITKHKGVLCFRFEDYDCTVEYYRSPFLVPQGRPPAGSPEQVRFTLRVDTMDWSSERWRSANILVFNAGHWWTYEKTLRGGTYFQVGDKVDLSMDVETAFRRSMKTWSDWIDQKLDPRRTQVLFRSYSPVHFRGGTWRTGGQCHNEKEPEDPNSDLDDQSEPVTNRIVAAEVRRLGNNIRLLNVTTLTSYRKDGHSSVYQVGKEEPRRYNRQDCSHWCLPGVPDTWNELLYATLLLGSGWQ